MSSKGELIICKSKNSFFTFKLDDTVPFFLQRVFLSLMDLQANLLLQSITINY